MTDPNIQYITGPAGPAGSDGTVDYTVVNTMVNQILTTNPSLKGVKGDQGNPASDAQVSAAVASYIQANEGEFKGADGVSPTIDYSQIISAIETWMQTDAIKPIFTGDAANVDTTALQNSIKDGVLAYMAANPSQFKGENGADGVSPTLNYSTIIEALKSWMQSSPEIISIFKGATGNTGLPGSTPSIDYNIVKNDVNNYLSANLSSLVSPTVIQSAFVDSNGNLITSLSSAISSSTSSYLSANPPPGASQSQVNSWVASYLSANPQGLTSDQVNTAIAAYLVANPPSGGSGSVLTAPISDGLVAWVSSNNPNNSSTLLADKSGNSNNFSVDEYWTLANKQLLRNTMLATNGGVYISQRQALVNNLKCVIFSGNFKVQDNSEYFVLFQVDTFPEILKVFWISYNNGLGFYSLQDNGLFSNNNTNLSLYINGVKYLNNQYIDKKEFTNKFCVFCINNISMDDGYSSNELHFGAYSDLSQNSRLLDVKSEISQIALYNRVLTDQEVLQSTSAFLLR